MENNEIINKLHQAVKRINDLETELENIKQKNSWNFASIGKKRLISYLVVVGLLLSIVVIAGTVTKPHTFSDGTVISASQVNANFNALFDLVNGNLTSENIASIDASDITTGTIDPARIPNLDASKITTGTIDSSRIATSITTGTIDPARIPNLDASKITTGTIDSSRIATSTTTTSNKIFLFGSGAMSNGLGIDFTSTCIKRKKDLQITGTHVRPFISTEYKHIKDIIPSDNVSLPVYGPTGIQISSTWTGLWDGNIDRSFKEAGVLHGTSNTMWWSTSLSDGNYDTVNNCNSWSSESSGHRGAVGVVTATGSSWIATSTQACQYQIHIICVAW